MEKYTLVGCDGNAFAVMGYVLKAMRKEKMPENFKAAYKAKAMKGDYNNLLCVSMEILDMLNRKYEDEYEDDEEYYN